MTLILRFLDRQRNFKDQTISLVVVLFTYVKNKKSFILTISLIGISVSFAASLTACLNNYSDDQYIDGFYKSRVDQYDVITHHFKSVAGFKIEKNQNKPPIEVDWSYFVESPFKQKELVTLINNPNDLKIDQSLGLYNEIKDIDFSKHSVIFIKGVSEPLGSTSYKTTLRSGYNIEQIAFKENSGIKTLYIKFNYTPHPKPGPNAVLTKALAFSNKSFMIVFDKIKTLDNINIVVSKLPSN